MKNIIKLITIIFILITISLVIINLFFDVKKLTLTTFEKAKIDSVSIDKVKVSFPNNIRYNNFVIKNRINDKISVSIFFETINVKVRMFELFKNNKNIKGVLYNKFNWMNRDKKLLPFIYSQIDEKDTLILNTIQNFEINNGTLIIDSPGIEIINLNNIDGKFSTIKGDTPKIKANFSVDTATLFGLSIKNIKSGFNINRSVCKLNKGKASLAGGSVAFKKVELDLKENRINSGIISAKKLSLAEILKIENAKVDGDLSLNITLDTSNLKIGKFLGSGTIDIKNLSASGLKLQKRAVKLTNIKSLNQMKFTELITKFTLEDTKIVTDSLIAIGKDFSIFASGYINQESLYFNYKVRGYFEKSMKDSMSTFVWNALLPEKDKGNKLTGRRYFICKILGVPSDPKIDLEREMIKSAAKSLFKSIGDEFRSLFN